MRTGSLLARGLAALALVAGTLVGTTPPTEAAAPMPPLDACLARGSFNIQDPDCGDHTPRANGPKYGPIGAVHVVQVQRGVPVRLGYPESFDFDRPSRPCGDAGCPHHSILWRAEVSPRGFESDGLAFGPGCGATDVSCTVRFDPAFIGDAGEVYEVVYGQHFDGIYPQDGVAWVLYTPPLIYPVRLDPVDSTGARLTLPSDFLAYAIRPGADPTQAECAEPFWFERVAAGPNIASPPCITLRWDGYLDGRDNWFGGWLPNASGTWTVVGAPQGDPGAPLLSRPSPYRRTTVTPLDNDIHSTIVGERRPTVALDVEPATTEMELGASQVVDVTVSAVGGEAGSLEGLDFDAPTILSATEGGPLAVVGVAEDVPEGFALDRGASRTFHVTVQAVGPGTGTIAAAVAGTDDIGGPARALASIDAIGVELGDDTPGAEAPRPPVVTRALDAGTAGPDEVAGTVTGEPGDTVHVLLAMSPVTGEECLRTLSGSGVLTLGTYEATIGDDGTGTFAGGASLEPAHDVYGVTIAPSGRSAVGGCTRVAEANPTLGVRDADVAEGGPGDVTSLVFTLDLSSPAEGPVSVHVATADGTATAPDDYHAVDTTVTIPAGQTSAAVSVAVVGDARPGSDTTLAITLSDPVGATLDPAATTATGTIEDDDGPPGEGGVDLVGEWSVTTSPDSGLFESTLTVDTHDQATGDWQGQITMTYIGKGKFEGERDCRGGVCTYRLTGTLKGRKLTLRWFADGRSIKLTGTLRDQDGTLIGNVSGKGFDGQKGKLRMTKVSD